METPIRFVTIGKFSKIRLGRGIDPSLTCLKGYLWKHEGIYYLTRNCPKVYYKYGIFESLDPDPDEPSGDEGFILCLEIDYKDPEGNFYPRVYREGNLYILQLPFPSVDIYAGEFYRVRYMCQENAGMITKLNDPTLYYSSDFVYLRTNLPEVSEQFKPWGYVHWEDKYT